MEEWGREIPSIPFTHETSGLKNSSRSFSPGSGQRMKASPTMTAMTWAQRLKRVLSIDIEVCGRCGGSVRVIACIEDQNIIDRILAHLRDREQDIPTLLPLLTPPPRAPPETLPLFAGQDQNENFLAERQGIIKIEKTSSFPRFLILR